MRFRSATRSVPSSSPSLGTNAVQLLFKQITFASKRLDLLPSFFLISLYVLYSMGGMHMSVRYRPPPTSPVTMQTNTNLRDSRSERTAAGVPPLFPMTSIGNVAMREVPTAWNRFNVVWLLKKPVQTKTLAEANYRIMYAPTREGMSDGIGHSMAVVNYELQVALRLGIAYSHRVSSYSTLTQDDPLAVEKFFGWGINEIPRTMLQKEGCNPVNGSWPLPMAQAMAEGYRCQICQEPKLRGRLGMMHLVSVPDHLAFHCDAQAHEDTTDKFASCQKNVDIFLRAHQSTHTIFQLPIERCGPPSSDSNFLETKDFFYTKYWAAHAQRVASDWSAKSHRVSRLQQHELTIAVHVRRGDFLDPAVGRQIIKDDTFTHVLATILEQVQDVGGPFSAMPIAVHVYSEGKLLQNQTRLASIHSYINQDNVYYDSLGIPRDAAWWLDLLLKSSKDRELLRPRLRVVMHISEPTLTCLHEMASADIFVGSSSGLSNQLIWAIARGLVVIPWSGTASLEEGRRGKLCCTVQFSPDTGRFDTDRLRLYWDAYSSANSASAGHALQRYLAGDGSKRLATTEVLGLVNM